MAKELNEDTGFNISIKTLVGIGASMATPPEISRMEFDMKDQLVRQTIMTTQEDVKEIKEQLEKLSDKIDELR